MLDDGAEAGRAWDSLHTEIGGFISEAAAVEFQLRCLFVTLLGGSERAWRAASRLSMDPLVSTCDDMLQDALPEGDSRWGRWKQIKAACPFLGRDRAAVAHSSWHITVPDGEDWRGVGMPAKGPFHAGPSLTLAQLQVLKRAADSLGNMAMCFQAWVEGTASYQDWSPAPHNPWCHMSSDLVKAWPDLGKKECFREVLDRAV